MNSCPVPVMVLSLILLNSNFAKGQDVTQLMNEFKTRIENPFHLSGQLGIQLQSYSTSLLTNRSTPFNGSINASVFMDIFGTQTPLNFIYSTGGTAYNITLPSFGFAGISPSHKHYTLHLGDRSIMMGKYAFSNHSFRGIGSEVHKQKWYLKNFYGRLQRAKATDYAGFQHVEPLLRRMGWGALLGLSPSPGSRMELSVFSAWDDPESLPPTITIQPTAAENVIISSHIEQQIGKRFRVDFDFSNSGYTASRSLNDQRDVNFLRSFAGILHINTSTRWNNALQVSTNFESKFGAFHFTYERIDPGYRTMGALFFQDDQENITAGITTQLFKETLSLIANAGIQNNNLNSDRAQEYARFLGSLQINASPIKWLNINIGYSNFSSVDRQVRILDPEAPARLTELALQNGNFSLNTIARISSTDVLTAHFSKVTSQTITQEETVNEQRNEVDNIAVLYRKSWPQKKFNAGIQMYQNSFKMEVMEQNQSGLALVLTKTMIDQDLNVNLNISFANNKQWNKQDERKRQGKLLQIRPRLSWQLNANHVIQCDGSLLRNSGSTIQDFLETRFRISYNARFQKAEK